MAGGVVAGGALAGRPVLRSGAGAGPVDVLGEDAPVFPGVAEVAPEGGGGIGAAGVAAFGVRDCRAGATGVDGFADETVVAGGGYGAVLEGVLGGTVLFEAGVDVSG